MSQMVLPFGPLQAVRMTVTFTLYSEVAREMCSMFFFPCDDDCHNIASWILHASKKLKLTKIMDGFEQSLCELIAREYMRGDALNWNTGPGLELCSYFAALVDLVSISVKIGSKIAVPVHLCARPA